MTQERNLPQNLNDEIIKMYEELRKLQTDLAKLAKEFYEQSVVSYDEVSGTPTDLSFFNNDMNFISEEEVDQKIGSIPPPDDSNYLKKEDEDPQKCSVVTTFTDLKATTQEQDDSSDNVATTKFVHQLVKDSSEDTKQYVSGIYLSNKGITSEQVETAILKAIVKYDEEENVEQKIEDAVSAIVVPTKVSDLQNDSGFITIGQVPGDLVTSVNGQTGDVTVQVPTVPTNVSSFTNDAGYITDAGVTSVNNQTGAVFVQENVLANWNSTSGLSAILNKPALKRVATTGDYDDLDNKPDLSVYAQTNDLATVATTGDYGDLTNTPTIPTIPTNVSDFTNDAGYLTSYTETDPTVPSWAKASSKPSYDYSEIANTPNIPTVPTNVSAFTNDAGYLTQHQDISGKADSASLATVATSGSYNDLTDTPTIPVDSDLVHKDGSENITGEKTFVGTKRVKFKQGANSDKLGFTCYTRTNVECGNFEVLPNDRAVNLGIYDLTNTPSSDWIVGFKCQAKDSNGTIHKFGLRAPSRLGNATYAEYYIPAAVNGVYADRSGNINLTAAAVGAATLSDVQSEVAALVDSAPAALDTLNELATALGNDPNFATTVTNQISLKYTKPTGGIPKTDLAADVQTSLNRADTALLSFTETDPTVPAWAKESTKPTYTAAEVGALPDTTVIPAAQVNSDWNAFSGVAQILNKPTLNSYYLEKTSVPNIISVGSASTWSFVMGTGNDEHTLIISGGNSTTPTLGNEISVATGDLTTVAPNNGYFSVYTANTIGHNGGSND